MQKVLHFRRQVSRGAPRSVSLFHYALVSRVCKDVDGFGEGDCKTNGGSEDQERHQMSETAIESAPYKSHASSADSHGHDTRVVPPLAGHSPHTQCASSIQGPHYPQPQRAAEARKGSQPQQPRPDRLPLREINIRRFTRPRALHQNSLDFLGTPLVSGARGVRAARPSLPVSSSWSFCANAAPQSRADAGKIPASGHDFRPSPQFLRWSESHAVCDTVFPWGS